MKKTIGIIVAAALFVASLATNVYYLFDDDPGTTPNVQEVVDKGKDVYEAVTAQDSPSAEDGE